MIAHAYNLPADWPEQVSRYRPAGAITSYIEYLKSIVTHHGEVSIVLDDIQELATVATGLRDGPAFSHLAILLTRLAESAGSSWPTEIVVKERSDNVAVQSLPNLYEDIAAMRGEWEVLNRLVGKGAVPIESTRQAKAFDWKVSLDGRTIGVEVKSKGAIGLLSSRLDAVLRGLAMTQRGQFMNSYKWMIHETGPTRSREFAAFFASVLDNLSRIESCVQSAFSNESNTHHGLEEITIADGLLLRESHFRHGQKTFAIECASAPSLIVDLEKSAHPEILVTGNSGDGGWLTEPGDEEIDDVVTAFSRLRIAHQAAARADEGLYVVAWPVPWVWEDGITDEWFERLMERIVRSEETALVALLPILMKAVSSFRLSDGAAAMFPSLRATSASPE